MKSSGRGGLRYVDNYTTTERGKEFVAGHYARVCALYSQGRAKLENVAKLQPKHHELGRYRMGLGLP